MNIDKIKEIIKNKKVQAISAAVAGVLIIAVAGTMILHNKSIENKNITIEKNLEDTTKEENKEELAVENTDEHIHDENCNHDDGNSTSKENNQEVVQNSDIDKQESSTESSSDKKATTTNSNKNDTTSNSNTNKNEHTHYWVEVYKDVHHAEEGHYENILVKEAWTESVPVYEEKEVLICNDCGADLTNLSDEDFKSHMKSHMLSGGKGSWRTEYKQVQTGTNTIKHDAVYEKKWVVDKQAWTEKVLSGYKCNSCGATK